MASIEDYWHEATETLDESACESWLTRLQASYSEPKRTYNNLDNLIEKLSAYREIRDCVKNPKALLLAIFFQK